MSNKTAIPFPNPQSVPVIGQPFTLLGVKIPLDAQLTCNCGGANTAVSIIASEPAPCPSCGLVYNIAVNPQGLQFQVSMTKPEEQVIQ